MSKLDIQNLPFFKTVNLNASENIERRGLESLGLRTSLQDYKSESLSNYSD